MPSIGADTPANEGAGERIRVVAAAVVDGEGCVLLARRGPERHQGGLWEFPGGKVEPGEAPAVALARELSEELGIEPRAMRKLIAVPHDYPDRAVHLDVWRVDAWAGEPRGREAQPVAWRRIRDLDPADFPAANASIIAALRLPPLYMITSEPQSTPYSGLRLLHQRLKEGVRLVQLRSKRLPEQALKRLTRQAAALCKTYGGRLLVNADPAFAARTEADGVHLSSERLRRLCERPLSPYHLVAASCHDAAELRHARAIGADFAVLGPVLSTESHPRAEPMGWDRFRELAADATMPVYAIGGMSESDLETAWENGAQGIAAIRAFGG